MTIRSTFAFASALLALVGCNNPTTTPDGGGGGSDAGTPDLPALTNGTTAEPTREAANYACNGTATAPTGTGTGTIDFSLVGFGSGDAVSNAHVYFFPDNVPTTDCTGSCVDVMTDGTGHASIPSGPLGGWYAYRVFPRTGATMASTYVDSVQINEPGPATSGGTVEGNAVSVSTLNLIPAAFGFVRVPETAIVAGEIHDCDEEPVRGALVRLFAADGTEFVSIPEENDAPHIQYFDGNENPDGNTTYSQTDGLYAAANIPGPPSGFVPVRAEAYGVITAGGPVELIGCEEVGVYGNGVSIVNLGPLRSDYPAGHPCADR